MKSLLTLLFTATFLFPALARAGHGSPTADTIDELVHDLQDELERLAGQYFLDPGGLPNFDDSRFNRLIGAARISVEYGRRYVDRGDVCRGMRWILRSVALLDYATRYAIRGDVFGSGFSDDLASFTRAIVEYFCEDLIVLAADQPGMPPLALIIADALQERGDDAKVSDEGNWTASVRHYTAGICLLYRFL